MSERTRERERDLEPDDSNTRLYEPMLYEHVIAELERSIHGRVVIKGTERPWDMHRQANSKRYLSPVEPELQDTATQDWEVFLQIFPDRSGKHRHQGGLVIFIIEGKGHTIMDGERHEWEAGDLMLLPMTPGGIEHQHFNHDPSHPAKWIAFIYWPFFRFAGCEVTQLETSPLYQEYVAKQGAKKSFAARTRP